VVSVVHLVKRCDFGTVCLDGKKASRISAYLTESTNDESPYRLSGNP
jgi:hypothetical protein